MRWRGQRESSNIEDRRGSGGGLGGLGGLGGGRPRVRRGGGIGIGTLLIALVISWFLGINPLTLLGMFGGGSTGAGLPMQATQSGATGTPDDELGKFVSVVLASTEDVWQAQFRASGSQYPAPKLVLYRGGTRTACGTGSAAAGPFYCPADQRIYIDLSFYRMLHDELGAPGDFAQAYVIAHEVGHHVQNVVGMMRQMDQWRRSLPQAGVNDKSVRLELQADCYAGVWAHHSQQMKGWLERGDVEEGLRAAAAVGDDSMMRHSGRVVMPDAFTHGSSEQRSRWFRIGLDSGDHRRCDTFSARRL